MEQLKVRTFPNSRHAEVPPARRRLGRLCQKWKSMGLVSCPENCMTAFPLWGIKGEEDEEREWT
jgi:hypothetical protein